MKRASKRAGDDADKLEAAIGDLPPPEDPPAFVILSGLPASGKSHFARELAATHPFAVLQIDALRKALFPTPVYSKAEHTRTFAAVHELIDRLLSRKINVLYDATNLKEQHRRALYEIGETNHARVRIVRVHSPEDVILGRLSERSAGGGEAWSSDANEDVYETMRVEAEPIERPFVEVDTSEDISGTVDKIVHDLRGEAT
jgi:predicted kinase